MSVSKNVTHGAGWIRRGAVAAAATAMAFTGLMAVSSPVSAAPRTQETTIEATITIDATKVFSPRGDKEPIIVISAMRGGSWS